MGSKSKKWRLWRSSSGEMGSSWRGFKGRHKAYSEGSDSSSVSADAFTAAVATVVRAQPKDFRVVRQEWAAIRIQTAFRGFLVNGFLCCSFVLNFNFLFVSVWLLRNRRKIIRNTITWNFVLPHRIQPKKKLSFNSIYHPYLNVDYKVEILVFGNQINGTKKALQVIFFCFLPFSQQTNGGTSLIMG